MLAVEILDRTKLRAASQIEDHGQRVSVQLLRGAELSTRAVSSQTELSILNDGNDVDTNLC